MALWRCVNAKCGLNAGGNPSFEFESDKPICPKCGRDKRKPEFANVIIKLEVVHFHCKDPQGPDIGNGSRYRVACGGSVLGRRGTAITSVVNCPACKKTKDFEDAVPEDERVAVDYEIEPNGTNIVLNEGSKVETERKQ